MRLLVDSHLNHRELCVLLLVPLGQLIWFGFYELAILHTWTRTNILVNIPSQGQNTGVDPLIGKKE